MARGGAGELTDQTSGCDSGAVSSDASSNVARTAGRGGLAVASAKAFFIVVGLVQTVALKLILGLDAFGALSSALAAASIVYNPIVSTSIQGVSRGVAQAGPGEEPATIRRVFRVHAMLAVPVGALFFVASWPVCWLLGMPHVRLTMQILSGVVVAYGLYAPLIGVLNGRKHFVGQASFDVGFAILRTAGLLGLGWFAMHTWHRGPEGAATGFALAAGTIFVLAAGYVGFGRSGAGGLSARAHLGFVAPLAAGQLLLYLLFQADGLLLRGLSAHAAAIAGLRPEAADPLVGAYRAAQLFCFLPYQLLLSITFVLFPLLAKAHHEGQLDDVREYVRTGIRLALVIAGAMVAVNSSLAGRLLALVFGADTAALGTAAMRLLSLGFGAFAIFGIFTTVLNSLKQERAAAKLTFGAFVLVVALGTALVYGRPFGAQQLWWMALSTSVALALATLGGAILVARTANAVVAPVSLLRVVVALAVAIVVGRVLPDLELVGLAAKGLTLCYAALVGVVYLGVLLVTRELGPSDLALVRAVLPGHHR